MVFGSNFKRKKGVHIGRRFKRGNPFRRAQEQRATTRPGDDTVIDVNGRERVGVAG